jgi:hypothetical protein
VHVEDRVEAVLGGPAHRLPHARHVRLVEGAAGGLERRPVHQQAHAVEAQARDRREVVLGEREHGVERGVGAVVVAELIDVDPAEQGLAPARVEDRGRGAAGGVEARQVGRSRGRRRAREQRRRHDECPSADH